MHIIYTRHAVDKMAVLGITENQIIRTIKQGSIFQQSDGFLAKHGYICVAYKKIGGSFQIKTVYER